MNPQVKGLIADPQQHEVISSIGQALESLVDPDKNYSNTARTMMKLTKHTPSAISLVAALMGHAEAGVLSFLGKIGFTEGKDALKLGMMRWLSAEQKINAPGFKSMVTFFDNAYKGQMAIDRGAKAIFRSASPVLTDSMMPSTSEINKLDKLVAAHRDEPAATVAGNDGDLGHYLPQHQVALAQYSTQALKYLQSIEPQPFRTGPLDKEIPPTPAQEARYDRAKTIAIQPSFVLQQVKDGTIIPTDIIDLKSMFPAVYNDMAQKIQANMIDMHDKDKLIPYRTKIGISMFLGQPLDASMSPDSIMSAQPAPKQPQQPQAPQGKKGSTKELGKSNSTYMTPNQAAEEHKSSRK